jgi:hypothetical protein
MGAHGAGHWTGDNAAGKTSGDDTSQGEPLESEQ